MATTTTARLVTRTTLSADVCAFTFEAADGAFRGLEPGAHVDVHLDDGLVRSYSLTDWDPAGTWLSVAVKQEPAGRGGSVAVHRLEIGDPVEIAGPRNNFPLVDDDRPAVLVGGGIGITPLYAMARALLARGCDVGIHYLVRSRAVAAFGPRLDALDLGDRYRLHCDDEDGVPDLAALVAASAPDARVYVCGPEPLLAAVRAACLEQERELSYERFAAVATEHERPERSFEVVLGSTGQRLEVPAGTSVLQVLREAGRDVEYSCSEGVCGSCIVDVLDGEVDHRDSILTEDERRAGDCMTICVSRARGARLVLDL